MIFPWSEYWSVHPFPSPGNLPNPRIEPRSPVLQVDSLPAEPQRKAKNTGVGNLFLLQRIFPTQELNQGLLHCRWILFIIIIFFYFTILYWFCHTSTCIRHGCTSVPHPEPRSHLPPHTIPLGHPSAPAPNN